MACICFGKARGTSKPSRRELDHRYHRNETFLLLGHGHAHHTNAYFSLGTLSQEVPHPVPLRI